MKDVAIIGGGIAGLTVAYRLMRIGVDVTLFEATERTGGVIRSEKTNGYLMEHGPNTIQTKSSLLDDLIKELNLENEALYAGAAGKNRYVVRNGKPIPVPTSPPGFFSSPLFSTRAKLNLLREPFIKPSPEYAEESVADFVKRRLGKEFLDYAINPFVAGVFAGSPENLSLRYAFPRMFELEHRYGSLIKGMIKISRERKRAASPMPSGRMLSFKEGLETLPDALAESLGTRIHVNTRVTSATRDKEAWHLTVNESNGNTQHPFRQVVFAGPLHGLRDFHLDTPMEVTATESVHYPPVSVVALGFRRDHISHPLDGFGMLVPAAESRFKILGTLFSSTLFPGRAPEGHVLLTTFVGGSRRPELAGLPPEDLYEIVLNDLHELLGVTGEPHLARRIFWNQAIPQYHVGYGKVKAAFEAVCEKNPGFHFTGNYLEGISVNDTVTFSDTLARRIAASLQR